MFNKRFARSTLSLIPAGVFSSGIMLADLHFASLLSPSFLYCHSVVALLVFLLGNCGKTIGHPFLVAFAKAKDNEQRTLMGSSLLFATIFSLFCTLFLWYFSEKISLDFHFQQGSTLLYFRIQLLVAFFFLLLCLNSYFFIALKKNKWMLLTNFFTFALNLTGNYISYSCFSDPDKAFIGLSISSLTSVSLTGLLQIILLRKSFDFSSIWFYWKRCGDMFKGQFASMLILVGTPFWMAYLMKNNHSDAVAVYNASNSLYQFLSLPIFACLVTGASFLGEIKNKAELKQFFLTLHVLQFCCSILPTFFIILLSNQVMPIYIRGNYDALVILTFSLLASRVLLLASITSEMLIIRMRERQKDIAKLDAGMHLSMLLLYFFLGPRYNIFLSSFWAILLPQICYVVGIKVLAKHKYRRPSENY